MNSAESGTTVERMKLKITTVIGYVLPLIGSLPPMVAWGGLMTVPFVVYLVMMIFNLAEAPPLPDIINPTTFIVIIIQISALIFLIWSVVYLRKEKTEGLVASGPYRVVRHPQYLSLIILTATMTYQSIWILQHTFGIGWLSVDQTKILWLLMLSVYAVIAVVEEMHLQKNFDTKWDDYKHEVGFLIPYVKYKSYVVEMLSGIIIPYAILEIVLYVTA